MKKKNLVRRQKIGPHTFSDLCRAMAIINALFMWSKDETNIQRFNDLENDLADLLHEIEQNNYQLVEKIPLEKGENT